MSSSASTPLETINPSPPHPKKPFWKYKMPMLYVTSSQLNPILKKPLPPPLKKKFLGKKKKKIKFNPLSKNCFGKGKKLNTQPFIFSFLKFPLNNLIPPPFHFT